MTKLPTYKESAAAFGECRNVVRLNEPTVSRNRDIRLANLKIEREVRGLIAQRDRAEVAEKADLVARLTKTIKAKQAGRRNLLPFPHHVSKQSREILKAERSNAALLRCVLPSEWARRVSSLPLSIRTEAASVIWWDFFGGRVSSERWSDLDTFITKPIRNDNSDELIDALIRCGYSPYAATIRIPAEVMEAAA